jgi:large subunit ribosomal protein L34
VAEADEDPPVSIAASTAATGERRIRAPIETSWCGVDAPPDNCLGTDVESGEPVHVLAGLVALDATADGRALCLRPWAV